MNETEELQQNNMISNLPLLFANGYPTSLMRITEAQLEKFVPFMVQCSLGFINQQGKIICKEPEWWPLDLTFSIPLVKPKRLEQNWLDKLKNIVLLCYQFHKSMFLLKFCNDLSAYEHARLRFINNYNSTTSLYDRFTNKLLVTFRNENMSYDQPQRIRKFLLQSKPKNDQQPIMVEPPPFDIYLCDNCDAELYSEEAMLVHEKTCGLEVDDDDDDDEEEEEVEEVITINQHSNNIVSDAKRTADDENVITCNSLEPAVISENHYHKQIRRQQEEQQLNDDDLLDDLNRTDDINSGNMRNNRRSYKRKHKNNNKHSSSQENNAKRKEEKEEGEKQQSANDFLKNFHLISSEENESALKKKHSETMGGQQRLGEEVLDIFNDLVPKTTDLDNGRKVPRRNRTTLHLLNRSSTMPISSPAGKLLLVTTKSFVNEDYCTERLERMERFCQPLPYQKNMGGRHKNSEKRSSNHHPHCTYKRPADYKERFYVFPTKRYGRQPSNRNLAMFNMNLLSKCRPISVRLKRITDVKSALAKATENNNNGSCSSGNLNIKLTRDTSCSSSWKISSNNVVPVDSESSSTFMPDEEQQQQQQQQDDEGEEVKMDEEDTRNCSQIVSSNESAQATATIATEIILDTIDLCSSDEENDHDDEENNDDDNRRNASISTSELHSRPVYINTNHEETQSVNFLRSTYSGSSMMQPTSCYTTTTASYEANNSSHQSLQQQQAANLAPTYGEMMPMSNDQILRNISRMFGLDLMPRRDESQAATATATATATTPIALQNNFMSNKEGKNQRRLQKPAKVKEPVLNGGGGGGECGLNAHWNGEITRLIMDGSANNQTAYSLSSTIPYHQTQQQQQQQEQPQYWSASNVNVNSTATATVQHSTSINNGLQWEVGDVVVNPSNAMNIQSQSDQQPVRWTNPPLLTNSTTNHTTVNGMGDLNHSAEAMDTNHNNNINKAQTLKRKLSELRKPGNEEETTRSSVTADLHSNGIVSIIDLTS